MVSFEEIQAAYYMVAATGVLIAAVFYVLNLRISRKNQELMLKAQEQSTRAQQQTLETRQAQMFMNIYNQTSTKEWNQSFLKVVSQSVWSCFEEYRELWRDKEFREAENQLGLFYEGVGVLVREGLLNIRMVAMLMCGLTSAYYEKHIPIIEEARKHFGLRFYSETEYLYNELKKYVESHPELESRIQEPLIL